MKYYNAFIIMYFNRFHTILSVHQKTCNRIINHVTIMLIIIFYLSCPDNILLAMHHAINQHSDSVRKLFRQLCLFNVFC